MQRFQRWTADFNAKDCGRGLRPLRARSCLLDPGGVAGHARDDLRKPRKDAGQVRHPTPLRQSQHSQDSRRGDVAVVRLTSTLTTQVNGAKDKTTEEGMDIFRRQPDGRWSIARFVAFTTRANKLLP